MDAPMEKIDAMLHQERDYLVQDWFFLEEFRGTPRSDIVDATARQKMAGWCYQVMEYCRMESETVSIAFSYLDRFLASPNGTKTRTNKSDYRLTCMTALYTAIKVHERTALDPAVFVKLSQGVYQRSDFERCERRLIQSLNWRMHPPSPCSFVRETIPLLPHALSPSQVEEVMGLVQKQVELAVGKQRFMTVPASTLAYCALMNALEMQADIGDAFLDSCVDVLTSMLLKNKDMSAITTVQDDLYDALLEHYCRQQQAMASNASSSEQSSSSKTAQGLPASRNSLRRPVEGSPRGVTTSWK